MKRRRMSNTKSKKLFKRTAKGTHPKNVRTVFTRGGIRL